MIINADACDGCRVNEDENASTSDVCGHAHAVPGLLFHHDHVDDVHHGYVNENGSFFREYVRVHDVPGIKHIFLKALTFLLSNALEADVLQETQQPPTFQ